MNEMRCKKCNKLLGEYSVLSGEVKIRILCKCKTFYIRHIVNENLMKTDYNESNSKNQSLKRAVGLGARHS